MAKHHIVKVKLPSQQNMFNIQTMLQRRITLLNIIVDDLSSLPLRPHIPSTSCSLGVSPPFESHRHEDVVGTRRGGGVVSTALLKSAFSTNSFRSEA